MEPMFNVYAIDTRWTIQIKLMDVLTLPIFKRLIYFYHLKPV